MQKNPEQWRTIFFLAAFISFVGNLLFVFIGTAKVQPWNDEQTAKVYELKPLNGVVIEKSNVKAELSK